MTNEEMIEKLEQDGLSALSDMEFITNALEENTKLKAEINRVNGKSEMYRDMVDSFCNRNIKLKAKIEQLKSELERSVKLPCKVGQVVYEIKSKFTKCTEHDCERDDYSCQGCECLECDSKKECYIRDIKFYSAENILTFERHFGKTIFLTREEAEQSLQATISKMETTTEHEDDLK